VGVLTRRTSLNNYPEIADEFHSGLKSLSSELQITIDGFNILVKTTTDDRRLSRNMKELIAFSIAVTFRCDGCIAHRAQAVIKAKANRTEVCEVIGVAILMGGGLRGRGT